MSKSDADVFKDYIEACSYEGSQEQKAHEVTERQFKKNSKEVYEKQWQRQLQRRPSDNLVNS